MDENEVEKENLPTQSQAKSRASVFSAFDNANCLHQPGPKCVALLPQLVFMTVYVLLRINQCFHLGSNHF